MHLRIPINRFRTGAARHHGVYPKNAYGGLHQDGTCGAEQECVVHDNQKGDYVQLTIVMYIFYIV